MSKIKLAGHTDTCHQTRRSTHTKEEPKKRKNYCKNTVAEPKKMKKTGAKTGAVCRVCL